MAAHWLVGTGGASSVFLALLVVALPRAGPNVVATLLGVYARSSSASRSCSRRWPSGPQCGPDHRPAPAWLPPRCEQRPHPAPGVIARGH
jgi:hypothetical protein